MLLKLPWPWQRSDPPLTISTSAAHKSTGICQPVQGPRSIRIPGRLLRMSILANVTLPGVYRNIDRRETQSIVSHIYRQTRC